jgi:hypothetical protein
MSAAALSAVGALVLAGVFQPESEGNRVLLPKDGAVLVQGQRSKANLTHHSGVYIPSSQCFFCICLKCGTTSLYQYIYGATHGKSWCEFAKKQFGTSDPDCADSMMKASLTAIGVLDSDDFIDPDDKWELPFVNDEQGEETPMRLPTPPEGTSLRGMSPKDRSEYISAAYWGDVFKGKWGGQIGKLPEDVWAKAYKHAIVRDPVQRLVSAWVNKLSCGLYSVPTGKDGGLANNGRKEQASWRSVAESSHDTYAASLASVAGVNTVKQKYKAPCHVTGLGQDLKACKQGGNFTTGTCKSLPIEQFADAIVKVYSLWGNEEWHEGNGHRVNGHFAPQAGHGSCFTETDPKEYDAVSTISDKSKMRKFSEHLPSHKLGLWGDQHSNNNGGNLYFEGKKFTIPGSVIQKLKKATKMEYKTFGKYL